MELIRHTFDLRSGRSTPKIHLTFLAGIRILSGLLHTFAQTQFFELRVGIEYLSEISYRRHRLYRFLVDVAGSLEETASYVIIGKGIP